MSPLPLVISEGEDFIFLDWTTHCAAELVPVTARHAGLRLRERIAGRVGGRAFKVKSGTMYFVGPRLCLGRDNGADGLSKFGVIVLRSNLYLVDGIQVGVDYDNSEDGVLVIRTIQLKAGSREMLAVRQNLPRTLRVFAGGMTPALNLRAGRQQLKCSEIPIENRHALHLLRRKYGSDVGFFCLKLGDLAGYFDRLRHSPDLQLRVDVNRGVNVNADIRDVVRLKSRRFHSDLVIVRDAVRDRIISALVCSRFFGGSLCHVGHHDLGSRHTRTLRVSNGASNAAVYCLARRRRNHKSTSQQDRHTHPNRFPQHLHPPSRHTAAAAGREYPATGCERAGFPAAFVYGACLEKKRFECLKTKSAARLALPSARHPITHNHSAENAPQVERPGIRRIRDLATRVQQYTPTAHQRQAKKTMATISFFAYC